MQNCHHRHGIMLSFPFLLTVSVLLLLLWIPSSTSFCSIPSTKILSSGIRTTAISPRTTTSTRTGIFSTIKGGRGDGKTTTSRTKEDNWGTNIKIHEETENVALPSPTTTRYLATCIPGLSHVLALELEGIHKEITNIEISGNAAVTFVATRRASLHVLCYVRTAHRLLELIATTSDDRGYGSTNSHNDDNVDERYYEQEEYNNSNRSNNNIKKRKDRKRKGNDYYYDDYRNHDDNYEWLLYDRHDLYDFVVQRVNVEALMDGSSSTTNDDSNFNDHSNNNNGQLLTLSVEVILNSPNRIPQDLSHSHYSALNIKNAICDMCVERYDGYRPNVDVDNPDVPLVAIIRGMRDAYNDGGASVSLYRSLHSGSLHRRGYRQDMAIHKGGMKETMAAGLLLEAGWMSNVAEMKQCSSMEDDTGNVPYETLCLIDPMAGSGTFVIEGALMASDIAPALMRIRCGLPHSRDPPVVRWTTTSSPARTTSRRGKITSSPKVPEENGHVERMWREILAEATKRAIDGTKWIRYDHEKYNNSIKNDNHDDSPPPHPPRIQFFANDIHPGAISIMRASLRAAGLMDVVTIRQEDSQNYFVFDNGRNTNYNDDDDMTNDDVNKNDDDGSNPLSLIRKCFVVTNPPWGVRLTNDIEESWDSLKVFVRDILPSSSSTTTAATKTYGNNNNNGNIRNDVDLWVLSGNDSATKALKLKRERMIPLQTGNQNLRWIHYRIRRSTSSTTSTGENGRKENNKSTYKKSNYVEREDDDHW